MQTFDSWVEESRKAACQIHIEKTNTEWFHHCALHGMDGCFPESYYEDLRRALCKLVEHWYSEGDDPGIQGCYAPVGEVFRFSDLCTFRDESMLRLAVLVSRAWAADQKLRSTAQEAALVRGELQEELQGCADSVNKLLGCSQQGQRFPCIPDVTTCSASDLLGWASSALEWIRSKYGESGELGGLKNMRVQVAKGFHQDLILKNAGRLAALYVKSEEILAMRKTTQPTSEALLRSILAGVCRITVQLHTDLCQRNIAYFAEHTQRNGVNEVTQAMQQDRVNDPVEMNLCIADVEQTCRLSSAQLVQIVLGEKKVPGKTLREARHLFECFHTVLFVHGVFNQICADNLSLLKERLMPMDQDLLDRGSKGIRHAVAAMLALKEGRALIARLAAKKSQGEAAYVTCAYGAAFLEFTLCWLNYRTFGVLVLLEEHAWQNLLRIAGPDVAEQLAGLLDSSLSQACDAPGRGLTEGVCMLLSLWTSVAAMPYEWIPPYTDPRDPHLRLQMFEWKTSHCVRSSLLGPEAAVLVAVYQAYGLLEGRKLGVGRPGRGPGTAAGESTLPPPSLDTAGMAVAEEDQDSLPVPRAWIGDENQRIKLAAGQLKDSHCGYYSSGCYERVGEHASVVWDDMQNLLLWQNPDPPVTGSLSYQWPEPTDGARLGPFVKELRVLKPFLLYLAAHLGQAVVLNVHYLQDAITQWHDSVVARAPERQAACGNVAGQQQETGGAAVQEAAKKEDPAESPPKKRGRVSRKHAC